MLLLRNSSCNVAVMRRGGSHLLQRSFIRYHSNSNSSNNVHTTPCAFQFYSGRNLGAFHLDKRFISSTPSKTTRTRISSRDHQQEQEIIMERDQEACELISSIPMPEKRDADFHKDAMPWLVRVRRHLHAYPELSWAEEHTGNFVFSVLQRWGLNPWRIGNGVVADIPGTMSEDDISREIEYTSSLQRKTPIIANEYAGTKVAIRADMDALPIVEETGLPFSSKHNGVMHACGHDGHTTMALGAAWRLLNWKLHIQKFLAAFPEYPDDMDDEEYGPIRMLFQPAEETANGARSMIDGGALNDVAAIFGGHLDRSYPVGTIIVDEGCVNGSTDTFIIKLQGAACHAARPHEGVDAVLMGSEVVTQLQNIVSRLVDPGEAAVVTVGKFTAGTAYNIVAPSAVLEGTVRAASHSTRSAIKARINNIVASTASNFGGHADVVFKDGVPPLVNGTLFKDTVTSAATSPSIRATTMPLPKANMGGEDFSEYLQRVPGFYVRYGAGFEDSKEHISAHTSTWDFNERALQIGAMYLTKVAASASRSVTISHALRSRSQ